MKKNIIRTAFVAVFAFIASYSIYIPTGKGVV